MGVRVVNKITEFARENEAAMDRALNKMSIDIERLSKEQVPFGKTGHLKASGRHERYGKLKYKTEFNREYARFQEFGGDEKRKVRRYSMPGKKAHYLRDPGVEVSKKAVEYFKQQVNSIRI